MSDNVNDEVKVYDKLRLAVDQWYRDLNLRSLRQVSAKEHRFLQKGSLLMGRPETFRDYQRSGGKNTGIFFLDEAGPFVVVRGPRFLNPPNKDSILTHMSNAVNGPRGWSDFQPEVPKQCWHNITFNAMNKLFENLDQRRTKTAINKVYDGDPRAALNYVHSFYVITLLGSGAPKELILRAGWDPGLVFRKLRSVQTK